MTAYGILIKHIKGNLRENRRDPKTRLHTLKSKRVYRRQYFQNTLHVSRMLHLQPKAQEAKISFPKTSRKYPHMIHHQILPQMGLQLQRLGSQLKRGWQDQLEKKKLPIKHEKPMQRKNRILRRVIQKSQVLHGLILIPFSTIQYRYTAPNEYISLFVFWTITDRWKSPERTKAKLGQYQELYHHQRL